MNDSNEVFETSGIQYEESTARQRGAGSHDTGVRGEQDRDPRGHQAGHEQEAPTQGASSTAQPEPLRPTGISWVTVLLGIACLVLASTVLTAQWSDLRVDWDVAAPAIVVGAGVLLLLAGAAGVVRGRSDEDLHLD